MPKKHTDISGQKFGKLTAQTYSSENNRWRCLCDCGGESLVGVHSLRTGAVVSCGCIKAAGSPQVDVKGKRFHRLVAIEHKPSPSRWVCQCDCGNTCEPAVHSLTSGAVKSCGCYGREKFLGRITKHGKSRSKLHKVWTSAKQRCHNPNSTAFHYYGARGIRMCDRWQNSFEAFCQDMGPQPTPKHTLERIDNDGNYEPGNVRWATQAEQCLNHRRNVRISLGGVIKTLSEWSKESGLTKNGLKYRVKAGWPEQFLLQPANGLRLATRMEEYGTV
jgi:hypothetical protein